MSTNAIVQRAADGLARRLDGGERVAATLNSNRSGGWRYDPDQAENLVASAISASAGHHGHSSPRGDGTDTLLPIYDIDGSVAFYDDPLLPPGLDSHRYRVIGNGVVAPVAEWIGRRLAAYLAGDL